MHRQATSSLCLPKHKGVREFSGVSFIRAPSLFLRLLSHDLTPPEELTSNTITVGVRFQPMNFGERHTQSVYSSAFASLTHSLFHPHKQHEATELLFKTQEMEDCNHTAACRQTSALYPSSQSSQQLVTVRAVSVFHTRRANTGETQ